MDENATNKSGHKASYGVGEERAAGSQHPGNRVSNRRPNTAPYGGGASRVYGGMPQGRGERSNLVVSSNDTSVRRNSARGRGGYRGRNSRSMVPGGSPNVRGNQLGGSGGFRGRNFIHMFDAAPSASPSEDSGAGLNRGRSFAPIILTDGPSVRYKGADSGAVYRGRSFKTINARSHRGNRVDSGGMSRGNSFDLAVNSGITNGNAASGDYQVRGKSANYMLRYPKTRGGSGGLTGEEHVGLPLEQAENPGHTLKTPFWNTLQLFKKNFYVPHPDTIKMSQQVVDAIRKELKIFVSGEDVPYPVVSFETLPVAKGVTKLMKHHGFARPTAIQSQGWPIALSGRDLVGIAQTDSGKTLAYMLPALVHIQNQQLTQRSGGPIAMILAPTRELVQQIEMVMCDFGRFAKPKIRHACVFDGFSNMPQTCDERRGVEVVITTPGCLVDILEAGSMDILNCTFLVLDDADKMLEMGFGPHIRKIMQQIRPDRQVLMWSTTWPQEVKALAAEYLNNYIQINIGSINLSANHNIRQIGAVCKEEEKPQELDKLDHVNIIFRNNHFDSRSSTSSGLATFVSDRLDHVNIIFRNNNFDSRSSTSSCLTTFVSDRPHHTYTQPANSTTHQQAIPRYPGNYSNIRAQPPPVICYILSPQQQQYRPRDLSIPSIPDGTAASPLLPIGVELISSPFIAPPVAHFYASPPQANMIVAVATPPPQTFDASGMLPVFNTNADQFVPPATTNQAYAAQYFATNEYGPPTVQPAVNINTQHLQQFVNNQYGPPPQQIALDVSVSLPQLFAMNMNIAPPQQSAMRMSTPGPQQLTNDKTAKRATGQFQQHPQQDQ